MTTLSFIAYDHGSLLQQAIAPWIAVEPVCYALVCNVAGRSSDAAWRGVITRDGAVTVALAQTPPWPVVIASPHPVDPEVVQAAVKVFSARAAPITGINGPQSWVEAIARAQRLPILARQGLRLHRLQGQPHLPSTVVGNARALRQDETELLLRWLHDFDNEIGEPQERSLESVTALLDDVLVWSVDGLPVAMAKRANPFQGGWLIGAVYTPPAWRRRGYAGAVTHGLACNLVHDGAAYVALYTDLANPTANGLYARIGFKPIQDLRRITWGHT
jgi:GNAT superfamily N-acetyltransferase